jgi:hypothetical protein
VVFASMIWKHVRLRIPGVGSVRLPSVDRLIFYAALGVLAAFEIIDWPIALIVAVGHLLAAQHQSRLGRRLGEALEQA